MSHENTSQATRREVLAAIGSVSLFSLPLTNNVNSIGVSTESHEGSDLEHFKKSVPTKELAESTIVTENGMMLFSPNPDGWKRGSDTELAQLYHFMNADAQMLTSGINLGDSSGGIDPVISARARESSRFIQQQQLPSSAATFFEIDHGTVPWFEAEYEAGRWQEYDEEFIQDPHKLCQETYQGETHWYPGQEGDSGLLSVFNQLSLDYMVEDALLQLRHGFSSVFVDHSLIARLSGLDFSKWAQDAFRDHLSELSSERKSELDINSPEEFDIREYIEENDIAPSDNVNPYEDPVFREYSLFHHRGIKNYWKEYRDQVYSHFSEADSGRVNLYGNEFVGTDLNHTPAASVYVNEPFDIVSIEDFLAAPPDTVRDIVFKLGNSIGRFEKEVFVWGRMTEGFDSTRGLDTEMYRPTLLRIQFGEGYANSGIPPVSLTGGNIWSRNEVVNNWVREDLTIDESLQSILDFVWAHKPYLKDTEFNHQVAVVYSVPTFVWSYEPDWFGGDDGMRTNHSASFKGAGEKLTRNQVPYDVITFGHTELWQDTDQLERLKSYDVVILPGVESMNDAQFEAIQNAVSGDTDIVVSGQIPNRTENFEPRDDIESFFDEHDAVQILDEDYADSGSTGDPQVFIDAVESSHTRQVELNETNIGVTILTQPESERKLVHLVNYEYDDTADEVAQKAGIELIVRDVETESPVVKWYSDSQVSELDYDLAEDELTVTVPELHEWGFLLITEEDEAVLGSGNEEPAAEKVAQAKDKLQSAVDDGLEIGIPQSEAFVHRAEVALEYDRYELASKKGEQALKAIDDAVRNPVIGIDFAQETVTEDLEDFRDVYDEFEYVEITEWESDALEALDIFVIPSGEHLNPVEFSVTEDDLQILESYVENGGNVILLGRTGMNPGMNTIAEWFGMEFGTDTMMRDEEYVYTVRSPLSTVTPFLPSWNTRSGVVIDTVGDADVLGWVEEEQDAYFESDGSDASGLPVMAGLPLGEGVVLAIGSSEEFSNPVPGTDVSGQGLIENVVRSLVNITPLDTDDEEQLDDEETEDDEGEEDGETERDEEDSNDEETDDDVNQTTQDDTTDADDDGAGFAVGGALAGAGGAAYLLSRRLSKDQNKTE